MNMHHRLHGLCIRRLIPVLVAFIATSAKAQSLLEEPPEKPGMAPATAPAPGGESSGSLTAPPAMSTAERLKSQSLFAVAPPKPRTYQKHDLVEVIINESSVEKMEQSLDTKKDYNLSAELSKFPSLRHLLELQLQNGDTTNLPVQLGLKSNNKYKGEGEFERKDNLTARLSAKVVDVKPNGTLVIEATESRQQDEETYTLVLSGTCRSEDITRNNTIQSSQLAGLTIRIDHDGQVKKAAEKGFIPRIFEAIFNF